MEPNCVAEPRPAQLADFPPEVLHLVTRLIDVRDSSRLYCSGSRILNSKLSNGGVKELNYFAEKISAPSWAFNSLLRLKKLTHLRIEATSKGVSRFDLRVIDLLPERIESLRLAFRDALSMWVRRYDASPGDPVIRPYLIGTKFRFLRDLELVADQWMTYETISSHGVVDHIVWETPMQEEFIRGLPLSLRHLKLAPLARHIPKLLQQLPRQLTSLDIDKDFPDLEWMPKKLVRLSLLSCPVTITNAPLNALRHTLTSLSFGSTYLNTGAMKSLPAGLLYLYLPDLRSASADDYASLPKGLKTLDFSSVTDATDSSSSMLPSSLTILKLGDSTLTVQFFTGLPKALTSLHIGTSTPIDKSFTSSLPPALHELSLPKLTLPSECIARIPRSVTNVISADASQTTSPGSHPFDSVFWPLPQ